MLKWGCLIFILFNFGEAVYGEQVSSKNRELLKVARIRIQPMIIKADGKEEPAGYPTLCSGFSVKSKKDVVSFMTAGHCLPDQLPKQTTKEKHKFYFVVDDGFIAKESSTESIQEGFVSEISLKRLESFYGVDVGYFLSSPTEFQTTESLSITEKPLSYGDTATIVGYPGGFGPVEFSCTYVGAGIRTKEIWSSLTVLDELNCPELGNLDDDIGGMSGGLVLNKEGKAVGIIVQQVSGSTNHLNLTRVGYMPLSEENINNKGEPYIPSRYTGTYTSKYLDWTSGEEVFVEFEMLKGNLHGTTKIINSENKVIEEWHLENGNIF